MKKILLIIFILSNLLVHSQSKTNCNELLNQQFNVNLSSDKELASVRANLLELDNCGIGNISSASISNISIVIEMIVPMIQKNENDISYKDIYSSIIYIQEHPEYNKIIDIAKAADELSIRKVNLDNWNEDKKLIKKLDLSRKTEEGYFKYLKENIDTTKTYKEIYEDFEKHQLLENFNNDTKNYELLYKDSEVIDFTKLTTKAKKENKPILIFFNGYACVNARKMEEIILEKNRIKKIILENFIFKNAYVDDQTKLPEDQWINDEKSGKLIDKIGMKNHKIQVEKFKSNVCPYFVIIDNLGNKIRHIEYTNDIDEFEEFLLLTTE